MKLIVRPGATPKFSLLHSELFHAKDGHGLEQNLLGPDGLDALREARIGAGYAVGLPDRLPVPVMALAMLLATFLSLAGSIDERV
jgi:hypothetical protein